MTTKPWTLVEDVAEKLDVSDLHADATELLANCVITEFDVTFSTLHKA